MSILGICGAMNGVNYYGNKVNRNTNQTEKSFNMGDTINLKMTDEDSGNKALTCVGFPDGSSASVFRAKEDLTNNPMYIVKYWDENGAEIKFCVNLAQVNPENASYLDMLAYSTHLDVTGQTKNGYGDFIGASRGINGNFEYDLNNVNEKKNYKAIIKEYMQMQYNAGNMVGYLSFKRLYDCMNTSNDVIKTDKITYTEKVSVESMLKAKYPNLVYNVGDATSSDWRTRNDYPFEALFKEGEKSTEMIENWKPTGANPKNQRYLAVAPNSKAVMIHPKAQERMENDPEFAKEVMERIESWWAYDIARNEAISPGCTIGMSQAIAIGEDGEIANVLSCGGSDTMRSNKQKTNNEEDEYDWWMERMARHAMFMKLWLEGNASFGSINSMHAMQSGQSAEREIHSMLQNGLREKLGDTICGMPTDEVIQQTFTDIDRCRGIRNTMMM